MKKYKVRIDTDALQDIQQASDWYNNEVEGLGLRFQKQVTKQIEELSSNPYRYSIRYKDIRCCLIHKFPFLIHFIINEFSHEVEIYAVIHTSRNPKIWEE